jgi:hypothetical protein
MQGTELEWKLCIRTCSKVSTDAVQYRYFTFQLTTYI